MLSFVCFRVAKNPIVFWLFNKNDLKKYYYSIVYEFRKET